MEITFKKLKQWQGNEGIGFQGDLYIDGKRAIFFSDDAHGGPMRIDAYDAGLLARLHDHVMRQPAEHVQLGDEWVEMPPSLETFIAKLVDLHEEDKMLRRQCKTKTVFALPGERDRLYRTIKAPYTQEVKDHIIKKYGHDVEIINERFQ